MRVLFVTVPWPTNFHVLAPLAWALRGAGHEVRIASGPGLADAVGRSGHQIVECGPDGDVAPLFAERVGPMYDIDWSDREPAAAEADAEAVVGVFAGIADRMADDLVAFARSWRPDLVVHEPTAAAGALVAAVLGVPAVRHLWGPDVTAPVEHLHRRLLTPLWERFGLTEVDLGGELTLDPGPVSLREAGTPDHRPVRYVPFNGPGEIPRWLDAPAARPRVLVTWGTAMSRMGRPDAFWLREAVASVAAELAGDDLEVLVARAADQAELLGPVPDGVRELEQVPLHAILPTCAAVVHHGGSGSTLGAVAAGVPQLVVALSPDQVRNALRIEASGAGLMLLPRDGGAAAVRAGTGPLVRRLLDDPSFGAAAARLRAELAAQPAPWEIVADLERLAQRAVPA